LKKVEDILLPLGTFPNPKKIIRVGLPRDNYDRPLKIVYENEKDANEVLRSNKNNNNRLHHFRPDLTNKQREHIKNVKIELKDRTSQGELNLTLRYKNNTPYITKNYSKTSLKN